MMIKINCQSATAVRISHEISINECMDLLLDSDDMTIESVQIIGSAV